MNLTPTLQARFPQGSIGPGSGIYQGECISFLHVLAEFGPMGDTYKQKKKFVEANGIIALNISEIGKGFRIGDIVVTSDGVNWLGNGSGHGFMVVDQDKDFLYAGESNFALHKRISYGRKVSKTDKKIYGIVRAPLKLDLGQCEINFNLFINNQNAWNFKFTDELTAQILAWTGNKLKVNFFPLRTKFENWDYEIQQFPLDGQQYKVIKKSYLDEVVAPLVFTSNNKPSDLFALIVRPDQWEGQVFGKNAGFELAWTNPGARPGEIQASCAEFDLSPFYAGLRLINHVIPHELGHYLAWINGMNDNTHIHDNQNRELNHVFDGLDFTRIKANL